MFFQLNENFLRDYDFRNLRNIIYMYYTNFRDFFVIWVLRPVKIISLFWAKSIVRWGDPREKPPGHRQAEVGLSNVTWVRLTSDLEHYR